MAGNYPLSADLETDIQMAFHVLIIDGEVAGTVALHQGIDLTTWKSRMAWANGPEANYTAIHRIGCPATFGQHLSGN